VVGRRWLPEATWWSREELARCRPWEEVLGGIGLAECKKEEKMFEFVTDMVFLPFF